MNPAGIFVPAKQQVQKSRLALSVAPDKAELPIRVDQKRNLVKNRIITSLIRECQICYLYLCHIAYPLLNPANTETPGTCIQKKGCPCATKKEVMLCAT